MRERRMPKTKSGRADKRSDTIEPERAYERSSPGSGEDEDKDGDEAADLQPDDVEGDDTAR